LKLLKPAPDLNFNLHPRQSVAFLSRAREILFAGAFGAGKSHLIRVSCIAWCYQIPGLQAVIFRKSFGELQLSMMQGATGFRAMLQPWQEAGICKILGKEIRFYNGSRISLAHLQFEPADTYRYLSAEFGLLCIDEVTQFQPESYRALRGRVRMTATQVPDEYKGVFPRILLGSNPGGPGHNYFKQGFVDATVGDEIIQAPEDDGGLSRQYIRATVENNPTMLLENPDYANSLKGLGSPELVKMYLLGSWDVTLGQFFTEFDRTRHVIKPFTIPAHWTRLMACDMGFHDPYGILWAAVASEDLWVEGKRRIPRGSLIFYREIYGAQKKGGIYQVGVGARENVEEIADKIILAEAGEKIDARLLDPAACHKRSSGPSEQESFLKRGLQFRAANNVRIPRRGFPGGFSEQRTRLTGVNGTPLLFIFDTCRMLIKFFPQAQHDTHNPEEMERSPADDLLDTCRYICAARPWITQKPPEPPIFRNPTLGELAKDHGKRAALTLVRV